MFNLQISVYDDNISTIYTAVLHFEQLPDNFLTIYDLEKGEHVILCAVCRMNVLSKRQLLGHSNFVSN